MKSWKHRAFAPIVLACFTTDAGTWPLLDENDEIVPELEEIVVTGSRPSGRLDFGLFMQYGVIDQPDMFQTHTEYFEIRDEPSENQPQHDSPEQCATKVENWRQQCVEQMQQLQPLCMAAGFFTMAGPAFAVIPPALFRATVGGIATGASGFGCIQKTQTAIQHCNAIAASPRGPEVAGCE